MSDIPRLRVRGGDYYSVGVSSEDWMAACEKLLEKSKFDRVKARAIALARTRNRVQNAHPDVSGRCATHGGTTTGEGEFR